MNCSDAAPLVSGLIDGELTSDELIQIRTHLAQCQSCSTELEQMTALRETTRALRLREPRPELWDQLRLGTFRRIEQATGWILFSLGAILAGGYAALRGLGGLIADPNVPIAIRVGLPLASLGLVVLLVSIIREKWVLHRRERYREVIR